jgi:long-subunit acyl-CoA synthetase (AMP-forming)
MLVPDCRFLFLTPRIGRHSLEDTLNKLCSQPKALGRSKALEEIVVLRGEYGPFATYDQLIQRGTFLPHPVLEDREATLHPDDVCNLQFTSGSTGNPKTAMLTH